MQILKTLTLGELNSKAYSDLAVAEKREVEIGSIVGKVTSLKTAKVPNPQGEFTEKLIGDFYAKTREEEYTASMCILPSIIHDTIVNSLADGEVEFAVTIGVKHVEGRSIPYQFTCRPLIQPRLSKPLQELVKLIPSFAEAPKVIESAAAKVTETEPVKVVSNKKK